MYAPGGRRTSIALILFGMTTAWGCTGDGDGVRKSDVTGMWQATSVEYVAEVDASRVDLVAQGAAATLKLEADGRMEYVLIRPGAAPDTMRATWQLMGDNGDQMKVSPPGASWYWVWDVAWSGNTLSLTGAGAPYDFDNDGVSDAARWNLGFVRLEQPLIPRDIHRPMA